MSIRKKYSEELKLQAVSLYLEKGISAQEIANTLDIRDRKRVLFWVKQFETNGNDAFSQKTKKPKVGRPKKVFNSDQEKMDYLEAENAYLRLLIETENEEKKRPNSK